MLDNLQAALDQTGLRFAHFGWSSRAGEDMGDYGVYAEDGENALYADDGHAERALSGTLDYFTRDASGAPKATVEAVLDNLRLAWYLNSIQFEEDTGYIHYEWIWEGAS